MNQPPLSKRSRSKLISIPAGSRYGRLVVLAFSHISKRGAMWLCRCDCGAEIKVDGGRLRAGNTKSCGCLGKESRPRSGLRHGGCSTAEYSIWRGMKQRCRDASNAGYKYYGARGISVCARWRNSFKAFMEDMGPRPSNKHSIDRINNNGNYEPSNCRWATASQQRRNQNR